MDERGNVIEIDGCVTVGPGEVVGIHGPGARAVLELASGQRPGARGAVRVDGADPYRDRSVMVGALWAEGGVYGELSLREVTGAWRRWSATPFGPDAEGVIAALARRTSIPYERLTPGERRLFDLVMALLAAPSALVVEEPCTGLDGAEAAKVWAALRGLKIPVLVGARLRNGVAKADRIVPSAGSLLAA
ncbi:ABC transporter [Actinocorallia sp. A-T 12471]|uniref:ABC transporter n=1 Tax=Actinocorallia sp. A-T 12471 TaxID=3089813 RepID=UPI0029CD73DB|nr:ABC transporter [Actinocorallia sp. A-T 12471]MDX6739876.1 ABC transporter [Actinocorallia sp. A-T 12471]